MNIEEFREFCLSLPHTTERFPFDASTLVFKVADKMFALTGVDSFASINLKCDPEKAIELRERFEAVRPGYHMSKKHWNTIDTDGSISDDLLKQWIKDSYLLIISKLTKKKRDELGL